MLALRVVTRGRPIGSGQVGSGLAVPARHFNRLVPIPLVDVDGDSETNEGQRRLDSVIRRAVVLSSTRRIVAACHLPAGRGFDAFSGER